MAEQWRILVVEGEENLNWNIVNTLQKDGYIVLGVTGGAEAIRTLWSEEYDVVICSQQMPDADGFDLLQWMRTYCPNARMLMLGGTGGGVNRTQALEMGVASYLEKPLDLHMLKEELRRLLHQTGFSASLDSFDLLDVIQIITMSRKSIALVVNTGLEEQGILRFQAGELIWAEYGTLRGEEAFFALAAHKNGTVVHRPWNDQITPNVTQPLSRLIFQALQYRSKYAEYQQLSSELEAVRADKTVSDPSTMVPQVPASLAGPLSNVQEEDRPFQFVAENQPAGGGLMSESFEQAWGVISPNVRMEQAGMQQNEPGSPEEQQKKAWWEPTGPFPSIRPSASMRAVTSGQPEQEFMHNGNINITPSTVHKTGVGQDGTLPSWLTDQPTHLDLPVLRGNTGQMPAAPNMPAESAPVLPKLPPTAVPPSSSPPPPASTPPIGVSAEWPAQPRPTGMNPSDSGLRKINPEESAFTNPHRVVRPNPNQSAPAEWQALSSQPGQPGAPRQPDFVERKGDTLQSLAALKKGAPAVPTPPAPAVPPAPAALAPSGPLVDPRSGRSGASPGSSEPLVRRSAAPGSSGPLADPLSGRSGALPAVSGSLVNRSAAPGSSGPLADPLSGRSGVLPAVSGSLVNRSAAPGQSGPLADPLSGRSGVLPAVSGPLVSRSATPSPSAPLADPLSGRSGVLPAVSGPPVSRSATPSPSAPLADPLSGRSSSPPARPVQEASPARPEASPGVSGRRNYPALVAALQTIGYSVAGFVASAVVGLDGAPIAQAAVDEIDLTPLCMHLSTIVQSALNLVELERGDCRHVVITSSTQHVLLRVLNQKKGVFQVLITTHETPPETSLGVLANVEGALTAAL